MSEVNKHGLSRDIPSEVERAVRQHCGFGCIVDGTAIINYHHFDPEYVDATVHNPDGITLLCPTCHDKVKKGLYDLDFIKKSHANPKSKQTGYTKDLLQIGTETITFKLGSASFKREPVIVYENEPLICFFPPETSGAPLRLNAILFDKDEKEMLKIVNNEWIAGVNHFDIETKSNELIIREKLGDIKLRLTSISEKEISVDKIDMSYKGYRIKVERGQFIVQNSKGGRLQLNCPNIFATLQLGADGSMRL